jgi:tripartite-type tricarboxylate transporter receptor subunit TctC
MNSNPHRCDAWYGLWAPKGTPKTVLDALNRALQVAVQDTTFGARMADLGAVPATVAKATPESLRSFLKSEIDLWGRPSSAPEYGGVSSM